MLFRSRTHALWFAATGAGGKFIGQILGIHSLFRSPADLATQASEFPMHVQHVVASTTFVKIIHVLGDEEKGIYALLKLGEGLVCGIRFDFVELASPALIEPPDQRRVCGPPLGRCNVFDVEILPQTVVVPKGTDARFC